MNDYKNQYIEKIKTVLVKFKNIDYAFIFGSITKILLPESDIDILIGGELDFSERVDISIELESMLGRKIDVVLARESSPELVLKAFSRGLSVVINNKENLKKDYFRNLYHYEDRENLRRLRIARIKRRYSYAK